MEYKSKGKKTIKDLFGCPGTITRVSNEETKLGRKTLGPGWVFIEYKDKSEDWQLLRPTFYETKRAGSWRLIDEANAALDADYELEDKSDDEQGESSDESSRSSESESDSDSD